MNFVYITWAAASALVAASLSRSANLHASSAMIETVLSLLTVYEPDETKNDCVPSAV